MWILCQRSKRCFMSVNHTKTDTVQHNRYTIKWERKYLNCSSKSFKCLYYPINLPAITYNFTRFLKKSFKLLICFVWLCDRDHMARLHLLNDQLLATVFLLFDGSRSEWIRVDVKFTAQHISVFNWNYYYSKLHYLPPKFIWLVVRISIIDKFTHCRIGYVASSDTFFFSAYVFILRRLVSDNISWKWRNIPGAQRKNALVQRDRSL